MSLGFDRCEAQTAHRADPSGLIFCAAVLLTDFHSCTSANRISQYFSVLASALEGYILLLGVAVLYGI